MYDTVLKILLSLAVSLSVAVASRGQEEERPLWEQEAMLIYSESSPEFARLRSIGRENKRLALYTRALEILHGRVEADGEEPHVAAQRYLNMLVADDDSDAISLASRYYLARIALTSPARQDVEAAKQLYYDLYKAHSDRFFGQMALVKYATLEIYDDDGSGTEVFERIQKLEPLAARVTVPELRRNFHQILGEAYASFQLDSRMAYHHLEKAYEMGIPVPSIRVDVLVRLAELGDELGQLEQSLRAYDELLLLAPRHERAGEFSQRARELRDQLNSSASKSE